MKLRYDTKRNPFMTGVLILVVISALSCVILKVDLTKIVFHKSEKEIPEVKPMSEKQVKEIIALAKGQNTNNNDETDNTNQQDNTIQYNNIKNITNQNTNKEATYKYTDQNGTLVIVDDINKIPKKYRSITKVSYTTHEYQNTEIRIINNQIWVPVTINNRGRSVTALLLLDTGSTNTSISPAIAYKLGIQPSETNARIATLANGSRVRTAHIILDSIQVGPKVTNGIDIQIMSRDGGEETGLLGMDFLKEHPHMIDTRNSVIRWQ